MGDFESVYLESKQEKQKEEFHRYTVQHALHRLQFDGSMVVAPIPKDKPIKILDSATGEGIWMIEEVRNFPQATFTGCDIEPAGFTYHDDIPKQISFCQHSMLDAWPEEFTSAFDLVHQRYGLTQVPAEACADVVKRLFDLVRPGGYIQLVDADLLGFEKDAGHEGMAEMMNFMTKFFAMGGMDPVSGPKLESWLRKAGAEDVEVKAMSFPMGKRAETSDMQRLSTWNQLTLVNNFAYVCSSK